MSRKEITQNCTTTALHPGNKYIYLKVTLFAQSRSIINNQKWILMDRKFVLNCRCWFLCNECDRAQQVQITNNHVVFKVYCFANLWYY